MSNRRFFVSIISIFITVIVTACSSTGGYQATETVDEYGIKIKKEVVKEEIKEVKTVTVTIRNFAFEPSVINISEGDTVLFVNEDGAPHTATAASGEFNTAQLGTGDSGSVTIAEAGTYEYFCSIHPAMKGTVVVE